jgi:AP-1 complex subunit mu
MDFGHPQFTEAQILKEFITTHAHKLEASKVPRPPMAVTGAVSWRSDGIKYKKNEVSRCHSPLPSPKRKLVHVSRSESV